MIEALLPTSARLTPFFGTHSDASLPWKLLGVHSVRMDMVSRDLCVDESPGLNCAWQADIPLTLTAGQPRIAVPETLRHALQDGEPVRHSATCAFVK